MACNIVYKNKTYTQADFTTLMADPVFAAELEESLLTDIYTEIAKDEPGISQATLINEVIGRSGTTFTPAEIQNIISKEAARRSHLNVGPVIHHNSIAVTEKLSARKMLEAFGRLVITGAIGQVSPETVAAIRAKEFKIEAAKSKAGKAVAELNRVFDKLGDQISELDKLAVTNLIRGGGINAATTLTLDGIKDPKRRREAKARLISIANNMNNHIKELSLEIQQSGALSNVQMEIFADNLGKYSLRAYRGFLNPDSWMAEMRAEGTPAALALSNAMTHYRSGYLPKRISKLSARLTKIQNKIAGAPTPTTAEEKDKLAALKERQSIIANEIDKYNDMLVDDDTLVDYIMNTTGMIGKSKKSSGFNKSSKLAIDLTSLKKKNKEIPQWYRDLLGEITDPIELYEATINKSVGVAAAYSFQRAFALFGRDVLFSTKYNKAKGFTEKLDSENYPGILDELGVEEIYILPQAKEELISELGKASEMSRLLATVTSFSNWNMTVGSVKTQLVNFVQAPMFMINNGNMSLLAPDSTVGAMIDIIKELSTNVANISTRAISKDLSNYNSKTDFMQYLRDIAVENGVTNSSVDFENIKRLADRSSYKKAKDWLDNRGVTTTVPYKVVRSIKNFLNSTYAESDNIIKLADFKVNLDRLSGGFKELLEAQKNGTVQPDEVRKIVAEAALRTREMVPNYAEVYNIIKVMRNVPLVGVFSSFYGEIVRTSINTLKWVGKDYQTFRDTGDTQYLRWSLQKLMGVSTTAGLHLFFNSIAGAGLAALMGGGDDDEPETVEEEASKTLHRYCLPPYYSSAAFVKTGDGQYTMLNSESVNPYGGVYASIVKMMNRKSLESESTSFLVIESILDFVGPVLGLSIQGETAVQMLSGKDGLDRDISNENFSMNPVGYVADIVGYGAKTLAVPGTLKERMQVLNISAKIANLELNINDIQNKKLAAAKTPDERKKIQAEIEDLQRQIDYNESRIKSLNDAYIHFGFKTSQVDVRLTTQYKARAFKEMVKNLSKKVNSNLSDDKIIEQAKEDYYKILRDVQTMYTDVNENLGVDITESIKNGGFSKKELEFITGETNTPPDIPSESLKVLENR